MNKYVGYRSPNLTVKLEQVQASVKMLQLREDGGCQGFPSREIVIARSLAQVTIVVDLVFKDSTEVFTKDKLLSVRKIQTSIDSQIQQEDKMKNQADSSTS